MVDQRDGNDTFRQLDKLRRCHREETTSSSHKALLLSQGARMVQFLKYRRDRIRIWYDVNLYQFSQR